MKGNRVVQNQSGLNTKAAVSDSYSLWDIPHIVHKKETLMTCPKDDAATIMILEGVVVCF